jgi:hypothetical protein
VGGMTNILKFFNSYAILIYFLVFIGLIFSIRSLAKARHEVSESLFGLERETAHRHISQALAALTLVIFLGVAESVLVIFLAPTMPANSLLVTPTINPLTTTTGTIPPGLLATIGVSSPLSTSISQTSGCIPGQIMITSPKPGSIIKGQVELSGTADIPNFGFYKYEFSPIGLDSWSTIGADRKITRESPLGNWDTSEVTPGDYELRLVVIDNLGNSFPPCIVLLRVAAP